MPLSNLDIDNLSEEKLFGPKLTQVHTHILSIKANNCATADESSHTYAWGQIISLQTDYLYRGLIILVALSPLNTLLAK